MIDVIRIAILERQTLLRGLVICFFIALPFCFLPTIIKHGFAVQELIARTPIAALYAFLFAIVILVAALMQNYQSLRIRKFVFDKPAFVALDFYGRVDGVGSIVKDLETFLMGKVRKYYFRINLIEPQDSPFLIEIVPFIQPDDKQEMVLKELYGFQLERFFGIQVSLTDEQLEDPDYISRRLTELDRILNELDVTALVVHESDL